MNAQYMIEFYEVIRLILDKSLKNNLELWYSSENSSWTHHACINFSQEQKAIMCINHSTMIRTNNQHIKYFQN
jgi:hypothetical protein